MRLYITLAALWMIGCSTPRPTMLSTPAANDPWTDYAHSIYDSAVFDSANVHPLFPMPPTDSVEVITWATTATANAYYPKGSLPPLAVDVWVTLSTQVQNLCASYSSDPSALRLRLQQLLGLQPKEEDRTFVVMKAATSTIFRPCTDPDPTKPTCGAFFPDDVGEAHQSWIAKQVLNRYQVSPEGYPWTRLGYTYDWNSGSSKFGASEYVIRKGAVVRVLDKVATMDYCHPG